MDADVRPIVEGITFDNKETLLEKYGLRSFEQHMDLKYYERRGAIIGKVGRICKNKTTGPCLLGLTDIRRIKAGTDSFEEALGLQPTLQNVLNGGYQASGDIRVCMETHEFAGLARDVLGIEQDQALEGFVEVAERTRKIIEGLHRKNNGRLHFYYTHRDKVNRRLGEITKSRCREYLNIMGRNRGEKKIRARLAKELEAGHDPNDMFKLRIFSTYTPGWWGDKDRGHTVVENIYNINTYIDPDLNPSWVALMPLRSLEWKREMAQGECIHVGNLAAIENAISKLRKRIPLKSPYHCNIGNILPYATEDCSTLVECFAKRDLDPGRCRRCLGLVEGFLLKIADLL